MMQHTRHRILESFKSEKEKRKIETMQSLVSGPSRESQRNGARPYRATLRGEERKQGETRKGRYQRRKAERRLAQAQKRADILLREAVPNPDARREITQAERLREESRSQVHFKLFWTYDPATGSGILRVIPRR
jgi:hypothetical protein